MAGSGEESRLLAQIQAGKPGGANEPLSLLCKGLWSLADRLVAVDVPTSATATSQNRKCIILLLPAMKQTIAWSGFSLSMVFGVSN